MAKMIRLNKDKQTLIDNEDWERNSLPSQNIVHEYEFDYRTYTQALRVYKWQQSFTE